MKNMKIKVKGDELIITVNLKGEYQTRSGRTTGVASTMGNKELASKPGYYVGLNVYKKETAKI